MRQQMAELSFVAGAYACRLATHADNDALCRLLATVPMEGPVATLQDRRPDFLAFPRLQGSIAAEAFVAHDASGRTVACGSSALREAYVAGRTERVGYVSDLRVLPKARGGRVVAALGRTALERARDAYGVEVFHTAFMDDNVAVAKAAGGRGHQREGQPATWPVARYSMASVHVGGRRSGRPSRVVSADASDLAELASFLDAGQRTRAFGYPTDAATLRARLESWPGLSLDDFLILRDASGGIAACAAPWSPRAVKRTVVAGYSAAAGLQRAAFNAWARVIGAPRLPEARGELRIAFLTHMEIADEDPAPLSALVEAARDRLVGSGVQLVSTMVPYASALRAAFRKRMTHWIPLGLYGMALQESSWAHTDLRTDRPGLEMALA